VENGVTTLEGSAALEGAGARARAYKAAQRHSTRVRWLKRAIPLGAAAAISLVLVVMIFDPFSRLPAGLKLGPISLSGTKVTMEAPRLSGFRNKDARPYEVTAVTAVQDVRKPNIIELNQMRAKLATDDAGGAARLEAKTGVFDTQKEQLELRQEVRVTMSDGQTVDLRSAFVDFKAGTVTSKEAVTVKMTNGLIEADALDVTDNGKVIVFTGRVRTVFDGPPADKSAPPGASAPARTSQAEIAPPPTSPRP
jgi:lipopolysaccharide export system protein LptC